MHGNVKTCTTAPKIRMAHYKPHWPLHHHPCNRSSRAFHVWPWDPTWNMRPPLVLTAIARQQQQLHEECPVVRMMPPANHDETDISKEGKKINNIRLLRWQVNTSVSFWRAVRAVSSDFAFGLSRGSYCKQRDANRTNSVPSSLEKCPSKQESISIKKFFPRIRSSAWRTKYMIRAAHQNSCGKQVMCKF